MIRPKTNAERPADLVFDTAGGEALRAAAVGSAPRIVSVAEEAEGVAFARLSELGKRGKVVLEPAAAG
jgi:hypothetical protein